MFANAIFHILFAVFFIALLVRLLLVQKKEEAYKRDLIPFFLCTALTLPRHKSLIVRGMKHIEKNLQEYIHRKYKMHMSVHLSLCFEDLDKIPPQSSLVLFAPFMHSFYDAPSSSPDNDATCFFYQGRLLSLTELLQTLKTEHTPPTTLTFHGKKTEHDSTFFFEVR